jgi:two-component system cell cycle response regulator
VLRSHILVADDDPRVSESTTGTLRERGYQVENAHGRAELFTALTRRAPDLVLLDEILPVRNSHHVLSILKGDERWREIPVLLLASQPLEEAAERTFGLGAADYIRKPFKPRELVARIQSHLQVRELLRSTRHALRQAEEELQRTRTEAESRRKLVDILNAVGGDFSTNEVYEILARRVARALSLIRCSIILAKPGDRYGVVGAAFDNPMLRDVQVDLDRYPELRAALDFGTPVLVEDIQTDPMYASERKGWEAAGFEIPVRSVIAIPLVVRGEQTGVFFLRRGLNEPPLTRDDMDFASAVVTAAVNAIEMRRYIDTARLENERLDVLAHTDVLTQVMNRRALTARLTSELERARRYDSVVTLLLLDLDYFKNINDTRGHLVGDDVLRQVARFLKDAVRGVDIVARFGGEEFVVVLPETPLSGGVAFAERIRAQLEAQPFHDGDGIINVTTSIGVAVFPAEGVESIDELIARADSALYRAKTEGRNRVAV